MVGNPSLVGERLLNWNQQLRVLALLPSHSDKGM